ncbi:MAG TPA: hypothetical protein VG711_07850 [Phycisphaerales bacterium]|nr:hypothetical protein [Phycisphaerales bacterium]
MMKDVMGIRTMCCEENHDEFFVFDSTVLVAIGLDSRGNLEVELGERSAAGAEHGQNARATEENFAQSALRDALWHPAFTLPSDVCMTFCTHVALPTACRRWPLTILKRTGIRTSRPAKSLKSMPRSPDIDLLLERRLELDQLTAMYALGVLPVDVLPAAAVDALMAGHDSPSLRQLAGADGADAESIRSLFNRSLDELGIPMPSPSEAGLTWARRIADDIVRGTVTPYDGAKQIWVKVYTRFPQLTELRPFVGFASEYEDDKAHREDYSRLILDECKKLLAGRAG